MNFLKETILHPKVTGAITPSSQQLTHLILTAAYLRPGQVVVELGPGTGVFTEEILDQFPADSHYLGIEVNETFATYLHSKYPGANIRHGRARDIDTFLFEAGHSKCDRIISGLPWVDFRADRQISLLDKLHESLADDGLFLTFSYVPFHLLPRGRAFRAALHKTFSTVRKTKTVFTNLPPAFVYVCEK